MSPLKDLVDYRRMKANETLRDARILLNAKSHPSAVNRIYYALFYEVTALLLTNDLSSAKHSGTRSLFNEHFVKTGIVKAEHGKFYSTMFDFRQKGDYGDFVLFEEDLVKEWISKAEEFIAAIERIIGK